MNIFYRAANFAFRVVCPNFWVQTVRSCPVLDDFINDCLDKGDIELVDGYHVKLREKEIWIKNYPYNFGEDQVRHVIPFPLTRIRLNKHIAKLSYQWEK